MAAAALEQGLAAAADRVPPGWRMPAPGELPSYPDDEITASIDVSEVLDRKVAALAGGEVADILASAAAYRSATTPTTSRPA